MTLFFCICIIFAGIKYYHSGRRGRKINQSFLSIGPSIVVLLIFYIRTYKFIISSKTLVLLAICFIANVNWANRGRKINQVYRSNGASIVVILILCTLNTKIFISIIYTWFTDFHFKKQNKLHTNKKIKTRAPSLISNSIYGMPPTTNIIILTNRILYGNHPLII